MKIHKFIFLKIKNCIKITKIMLRNDFFFLSIFENSKEKIHLTKDFDEIIS